MATYLTPHFTLEEFTVSQIAARLGISNMPPPRERQNLQRLAETMEKVRFILGGDAVFISSGYRSPEVNRVVGGSPTSAHMSGLAADFICPSFGTPLEICETVGPHMVELGIDQLIHEFNSWVHLGLTEGTPRNMALTIDNSGTRTGWA